MKRRLGFALTSGLIATSLAVTGLPTASAAPQCHGKPVTMVFEENSGTPVVNRGTKGDDVVLLKGTAWQTFHALAGDDTVCVQGHRSVVFGGRGNDWISGRSAQDEVELHGGAGDDVLISSERGDPYGPNEIWGGPGRDTIRGGSGDDHIDPDRSDDADDDVSQDDADIVTAGAGDDDVSVYVVSAARTEGADRIDGGSGVDLLTARGAVRARLDLRSRTVGAAAGGPADGFRAFQSYATAVAADITGNANPNDIWVFGGTGTTIDSLGGNDKIEVSGKDVTVHSGSGDDRVDFSSYGKRNRVDLGSGDDQILIFGSKGTTVEGGPGDDQFGVRVYGEIGEEEDMIDDLLPIRAQLKGESGDDTLTWDCKSTVDTAKHSLKCKRADVRVGGMQGYKASRNRIWKDVFRGSSRPETFYGGGRDDTMRGSGGKDRLVGGAGNDYADGGPGADRCNAERKVSC